MQKRRVIGALTVLAGLPGIGVVLLFAMPDSVSAGIMALALLAFVVRGVCGIAGGVLLWRGSRLGYQLSVACWSYLVIVGAVALVQLHTRGITPSLSLDQINFTMYLQPLSKSLGKLVWGLPILFVLIRDLRKGPSDESPVDEQWETLE